MAQAGLSEHIQNVGRVSAAKDGTEKHIGYRKGDFPEISVVGCDGSEHCRDPLGALPFAQNYDLLEFCRF